MSRVKEIDTAGWTKRVQTVGAEALACQACGPRATRWYRRESAWIRRNANPDWSFDQACAIFAILSTNESIARNELNYLTVAAGGRVGPGEQDRGGVGHTGDVGRRIDLALAGRIEESLAYSNAAKIATFYLNLRYPRRAWRRATIDRHAADIITGDRATSKSLLERANLRGYRALEAAYVEAGDLLGLAAHELQAVTWVHWVYCEGNA